MSLLLLIGICKFDSYFTTPVKLWLFYTGLPCHPGPETSGIVYGGSIPEAEEQERPGDPRGQVIRARLAHLRQIINPPERYGEAVWH